MISPLFGKQEVGIWWIQKRFPRYGVPIWILWPNIRSLPSIIAEKNVTKNVHICSMCIKINKVGKQEVGIWWVQKCDEKCAYMFNVYKNQLSWQTGSRNLTDPKTLPTIWYTYMMLVTKYQISAINGYWEKCDEKYLGRTEVKQYTPSPFVEWGYKNSLPPPPSWSGGIIILL
jgi:hypothetical protein